MIPSVVRGLSGPLYDRLRFGGGIATAEAELLRTDRASREDLDASHRDAGLVLRIRPVERLERDPSSKQRYFRDAR